MAPSDATTVLVGIDDTDMPGTPGTNRLGRRIAESLPSGFEFTMLLRHQLFLDDRVPYTSQNGSASLAIQAEPGADIDALTEVVRREMRHWFVPGSDPGFCITTSVPDDVIDFGQRCQRDIATQDEAMELAERAGLQLEALGGTGGGIIGALAAVGLLAGGDDGRVVHLAGWSWPDSFTGVQPVERVLSRGVHDIVCLDSGESLATGLVDVGKHLRPAYRRSRVVMFVEATPTSMDSSNHQGTGAAWRAVKLT